MLSKFFGLNILLVLSLLFLLQIEFLSNFLLIFDLGEVVNNLLHLMSLICFITQHHRPQVVRRQPQIRLLNFSVIFLTLGIG
jgi:hypothetical protein